MKNNQKIVSIGIPAYNEEKSISTLLESLKSQSILDKSVKEVIIEIDGSSDNTYKVAMSYKSIIPQLQIYKGKSRKGKSFRLNHILSVFSGEILVFIDSDVKMADKNSLSKLIKPITDLKTDMTYGSKEYGTYNGGYISRITIMREQIWRAMRDSLNNGNNIYNCSGSLTAISKSYANKLVFPENLSSDNQYIYLNALDKGIKPIFVKNAIIYAKPASKLKDFITQNVRLRDEYSPIAEIFGSKYLNEYRLPLFPKFRALLVEISKRPILGLYAIFLDLIIKFYPGHHNNHLWEIANTTKDLI